MNSVNSVAIIGLGTMGSAIAERLESRFELVLIDVDKGEPSDVSSADAIIIAVKPQHFAELSDQLKPYIRNQVIISIMAGVRLQTLADAFPKAQVTRTMPNLALKNGQSVTAAFPKNQTVQNILETWGTVVWLDDEAQFDAFTALAGSGPAYFFKLAEALKTEALKAGFTPHQADDMAIQTFKGAASVIDADPGEWVARVASKGGTTEAALGILADRGFDQTMSAAVRAATERSRELSKND